MTTDKEIELTPSSLKATNVNHTSIYGQIQYIDMHEEGELNSILNGCLRNERDSQKMLYRIFYGYAISICMRYASNSHEAIELLNQGFLKVFQDISSSKQDYYTEGLLKSLIKQSMLDAAISNYRADSHLTVADAPETMNTLEITELEKEFEIFESRLLEAVRDYRPSFNIHSWFKMQLLLQERDTRRRRRVFPYLLITIVLTLAICSYLIYHHATTSKKNAEKNIAVSFIEKEKLVVDRQSQLGMDIRKRKDVVKKKIDIPHNENNSRPTQNPEKAKEDDRRSQKVEKQGEQVKDTNRQRKVSQVTDVTVDKGVLDFSNNKESEAPDSGKPVTDSKRLTENKSSISGDSVIREPVGRLIDFFPSNHSIPTVFNERLAFIDEPTFAAVLLGRQPVKTFSDSTVKGREFSPGWYFQAYLSSEGSGVHSITFKNATNTYGVGIGYAFAKKISLQTGVYGGKKIYSTSADDYYTVPGSYLDTADVRGIEADCFIFEIPISLRYNLVTAAKRQIYGIAGLSSYILRRESYKYLVYYRNGQSRKLNREFEYNTNWMSVVNLGLGYQQKLTRRVSVQIDSYLKSPLAGLGEGKVHLYSTGFLVGVRYQALD